MRCSLQFVNEALRCMGEGVLRNVRDGDIGAVFGLGFPPFRGGPFRYVDSVGASEVLRRIGNYFERFGKRWEPAPLLVEMAKSGQAVPFVVISTRSSPPSPSEFAIPGANPPLVPLYRGWVRAAAGVLKNGPTHTTLNRIVNRALEDGLEPVLPLDLGAVKDFDELAAAMARTAFGGRQLGEAVDVLVSMARDPGMPGGAQRFRGR